MINITDSVSAIKLEITADYIVEGIVKIPAQTIFLNKDDVSFKAIGNDIVIHTEHFGYTINYASITTPVGASAAAIAALLTAFLYTTPIQFSSLDETADASGTIPAGATYILFITTGDFDGVINGASMFGANNIPIFDPRGRTLPAVDWSIAAGRITIHRVY